MRLVSIDGLTPGMRVAKPVYDGEGRLLLAKGVEIKPAYSARLKDFGVWAVFIIDEKLGEVKVDDVVSEQTRVYAVKQVRLVMNDARAGKAIGGERLKKVVSRIVDELLQRPDLMVRLAEVRALRDYTFAHSVSTCVFALMIAIRLGFGEEPLRELGTGTLLHDVGKMALPPYLLDRPGSLSEEEYEIVKAHTTRGYEILKDQKGFSQHARLIALQHHERLDGSGYPSGLRGEEIAEYSRIAMVADFYDAVTTDRAYRPRSLPHEALGMLMDGAGVAFDRRVVEALVRSVAIYPVGSTVRLTTGQVGIVCEVKAQMPSRPVVKIVREKDGSEVTAPYTVDLSMRIKARVAGVEHGE